MAKKLILRRRLLRFMAAASMAGILGFNTIPPASASAVSRPNVLIVVADDLGFSDLGVYGSEIQTPNLDSLAQSGVCFSNFHAAAICAPTRAMLLTGVDHHRAGVGNMPETTTAAQKGAPGYTGALNDRVVTLATRLKDSGYHTYHIGKWHLGKTPEKLPISRGFEQTVTMADSGADNFRQRTYMPMYEKAHWFRNGKPLELPGDFYSSRYLVDEAIGMIDGRRDKKKPFFAYLGFQAVHIPVQAPKRFADKYHGLYDNGWSELREQRYIRSKEAGVIPRSAELFDNPHTDDWHGLPGREKDYKARQMEVYAGMVDAMDFHLGRLIDYLKQTGQFENTIVFFVSDNGPEPTDPVEMLIMQPYFWWANYKTDMEHLAGPFGYVSIGANWAGASASPGRWYKYFAGEGGVRVPAIFSYPAWGQAPRIYSHFAYIKDVVPTILDLAGIGLQSEFYQDVEPVTGKSLVHGIKRNQPVHAENEPVGYELMGNSALYRGEFKLVRNLPPKGDGFWHLYNIAEDPGECNDLINTHPGLAATMMADYREYEEQNLVIPIPGEFDYEKQIMINGTKAVLARNWGWGAIVGISLLVLVIARSRLLTRREDD